MTMKYYGMISILYKVVRLYQTCNYYLIILLLCFITGLDTGFHS